MDGLNSGSGKGFRDLTAEDGVPAGIPNRGLRGGRHIAFTSMLAPDSARLKRGHLCGLAEGTVIETRDGPVPVEALCPGQRVLTRDDGYLPVRWIGRVTLDAELLELRPEHRPVTIRRDSIAPGVPEADLVAAPRQRMLISSADPIAETGEREAFMSAHHLRTRPSADEASPRAVRYFMPCFDAHRIIRANGAWTESFLPEDKSLRALPVSCRDELFSVFPALRDDPDANGWTAARTMLPVQIRQTRTAA